MHIFGFVINKILTLNIMNKKTYISIAVFAILIIVLAGCEVEVSNNASPSDSEVQTSDKTASNTDLENIVTSEYDSDESSEQATIDNAQAVERGVSAENDRVVVITMTRCPECREGLKPYLDKTKELGVNIKEYQVSSPFDPKVNQILSENGLKRTSGGMPIVCINDNCFTIMRTVEAELNKFIEQKI